MSRWAMVLLVFLCSQSAFPQDCSSFCTYSTSCSIDCIDGSILNTCGGYGVCSGGNSPVTPPSPPTPPPPSVLDCSQLCSSSADCSIDCVDGSLLTTCGGWGSCAQPPAPVVPSCGSLCATWSACDTVCDDSGVASTCAGFGICAPQPSPTLCTSICNSTATCSQACTLNNVATTCGGYGNCQPPPVTCTVDTCFGGACDRPTSDGVDLDCDQIADTLEYDLAHKYFPSVLLQYQIIDINPAYLAKGWATPYTVQPLAPQGVCDEPLRCLELRFAIAFENDCGDVQRFVPNGDDTIICDLVSTRRGGHPGDSEFYAVVVRSESGDWLTAKTDPTDWRLIRDFTSSHWGEIFANSSVHGAYGFCPPACRLWDQFPSGCQAHEDQCSWFDGLCGGGLSAQYFPCSDYSVLDGSCYAAGGDCKVDFPAGCYPEVADMQCYSRNPVDSARTIYSAEGKHALYHSDEECDDGGVALGDLPIIGFLSFLPILGEGADECPINGYDLRNDKEGLLQNIGWYSSNCAYRDVDIQDPNGCDLYNVWCSDPLNGNCKGKFGEATGYSEIFQRRFNWSLPSLGNAVAASSAPYPVASCGDGSCSTEEVCETCSADCGPCASSLTTARYLDLDGSEWAVRSGGQHSGLTGGAQKTWAFWLQGRGRSGAVASIWQAPDPHRIWRIAVDDIGRRLQVFLFNEAVGEPVFVSTDHFMSSSSGWHFVVIQFDGSGGPTSDDRIAVWVDDIRLGLSYSGPAAVPTQLAASNTAPFEIGVNGSTFDGSLGELVILDGTLSAIKRSEWRSQGIDWSDSRIISGYRWAESLADEVGSNHLSGTGIEALDYRLTSQLPVR